MIPNWFSYRGKGSSLSFYAPSVFQGLVVWVVWQGSSCSSYPECKAIIKNKSNGFQLFEATVYRGCRTSWFRYLSISEMAMKEYCEDEELELCVGLYMGAYAEVFEFGIHVIVEKTDSFEGSEWDHDGLYNFIEIDGEQVLRNFSKYTKDLLLEVLFLSLLHTNKHTIGARTHTYINRCLKSQHSLNSIFMQRIDYRHGRVFDYCMIPKWFSYSGEGCSLSFRIPPVFEGLVICAVCSGGCRYQEYKAIIKNKRNGIQLFEATHARPYFRRRLVRVISAPEIAMEKYCGDDEVELQVILRSGWSKVVRCGIHVIETHQFGPSIYDIYDQEFLEGSDGDHDKTSFWDHDYETSFGDHDIDYYETSFEIDNQEYSEVESDRVIPSPPYHLLHHPRHGSMRFSTGQQWEAFLIRAAGSLREIKIMQKFSHDDLN
jgi:hypothetical protein